MGLTLLAQAQMPLSFWWGAFHTSAYIISRLPSSPLQNKSPYQVLFNEILDYSKLHPFGCSIFPCLTHYNNKKLQFYSQKCLFIGYSDSHKGFKCLFSSGRLYISRHVVFNHNEFPFLNLFSSNLNSNNSNIALLPMQITHILIYIYIVSQVQIQTFLKIRV